MKITFIGATSGVTGSKTLVEMPEGKILIDCGLYQGSPEGYNQNFLQLPVDPHEIKAVILTHAHLDHTGYLPKLFKDGFRGSIYGTMPTLKLMRLILEDSASLDDSKLYDENHVRSLLGLCKPVDWSSTIPLLGGSFALLPAGHILGASSVCLKSQSKTAIFSGDLGRQDDYLLNPPLPSPVADALILESTYGGRIRSGDMGKELSSFLVKISREKRVGIIASFAVARAQTLLTMINDFFLRHPGEKIRIVADSPMMREASKIYEHFAGLTRHSKEMRFALEGIEFLNHPSEWEALKEKTGPLLIISSSGMVSGGRIWRHLENWQNDSQAILFLPGYQGKGTPGRALSEGERVIHREKDLSVHWHGEVLGSEAFSSHADQNELLEWVKNQKTSTWIFLNHGEPEAKLSLKTKLAGRGFTKVEIPLFDKAYEI